MAQFTWPPVSFSGNSNPSVGVNGDTLPTDSTLVGGSDGTNLRPIKTGTDGTQYVILAGTSAVTGHVIVDSGTISKIETGTVTINGTPAVAVASGTLGLVSSLASGTVTINGGTIASLTSGTVTVASGTLGLVSSLASGTVTINGGTISSLATGTVTIVGTPAVAVASGTLGLVSSLASGTVTLASATVASLTSGTVTISGTPNVGVIQKTGAAGTISQAAVTVGTAAVQLTVSGAAPTAGRLALVVTPDASSTAKFYVGASTVTPTSTTRGIQLVGGQPLVINNDASPYYICSDTASQTVYIMEVVP